MHAYSGTYQDTRLKRLGVSVSEPEERGGGAGCVSIRQHTSAYASIRQNLTQRNAEAEPVVFWLCQRLNESWERARGEFASVLN